MFDVRHVRVLAAAATHLLQSTITIDYTLTLAAELQGVQQPGGPTDRHRADQCRLQLVCLYQRCGVGEQQARVEDRKRAANDEL